MITAEQIKTACEQLRDELTEARIGPLIYPMAFDIIASRGELQQMLAIKLNGEL